MSNLERRLEMIRDRRIDFGEFVTCTRGEYRAMAMHLMRKWQTPEWFLIDDVEQELYLETWRVIGKFQPERGTSLTRYVVFNSMSAAKRAMHKARGAGVHGSPDKRASNVERTFASFRDDDESDALMASILAEGPRAEEDLIESRERKLAATRALKACETKQERYVVLAIRESGSLDTAGRLLYDDMDHRIALRLGSEEHAERFVQKHARAVALRIDDCVRPF
jgi:hypothetical protein